MLQGSARMPAQGGGVAASPGYSCKRPNNMFQRDPKSTSGDARGRKFLQPPTGMEEALGDQVPLWRPTEVNQTGQL